MAEDVANSLGDPVLRIDAMHKSYLAGIRHWHNLKMAAEGTDVWVKDFSEAQISDSTLRSVPFADIFRLKDNLLFPEGSLLPSKKMPGLLWTPIEKILPLTLPDLNLNYFGLQQQVAVRLTVSETEQETSALLTDRATLAGYIHTAPALRLAPLQWVILDQEQVLIIGIPLLPVNGEALWKRNNMLLPAGYDLEWPLLAGSIAQKLNPDGTQRILWQPSGTYTLIPENKIKALSLSSFRKTFPADLP